jgi:hypothetical protein
MSTFNNAMLQADVGRQITLDPSDVVNIRVTNFTFQDVSGGNLQISFDGVAKTLGFVDDAKAVFGTGSDWKIFTDSSNTFTIQDGVNSRDFLNFKATQITIGNATDALPVEIHGNASFENNVTVGDDAAHTNLYAYLKGTTGGAAYFSVDFSNEATTNPIGLSVLSAARSAALGADRSITAIKGYTTGHASDPTSAELRSFNAETKTTGSAERIAFRCGSSFDNALFANSGDVHIDDGYGQEFVAMVNREASAAINAYRSVRLGENAATNTGVLRANSDTLAFFGFSTESIAVGASGQIQTRGIGLGYKLNGDASKYGDPIYLDDASGFLTTDDTDIITSGDVILQVGYCMEAKAAGGTLLVFIQPMYIRAIP